MIAPASHCDGSPEPGSPSGRDDLEWAPGLVADDRAAAFSWKQYAGAVGTERAAPERGPGPAAAGGSWGSGAAGGGAAGLAAASALDDWEEAELALLSPESQKRERRRIANRDCARRIRQRQTVGALVGGRAVAGYLPAPEQHASSSFT